MLCLGCLHLCLSLSLNSHHTQTLTLTPNPRPNLPNPRATLSNRTHDPANRLQLLIVSRHIEPKPERTETQRLPGITSSLCRVRAPFRIKRSVTPRSPFMAEYKSAVNPYCIREVGTDKPHTSSSPSPSLQWSLLSPILPLFTKIQD